MSNHNILESFSVFVRFIIHQKYFILIPRPGSRGIASTSGRAPPAWRT